MVATLARLVFLQLSHFVDNFKQLNFKGRLTLHVLQQALLADTALAWSRTIRQLRLQGHRSLSRASP